MWSSSQSSYYCPVRNNKLIIVSQRDRCRMNNPVVLLWAPLGTQAFYYSNLLNISTMGDKKASTVESNLPPLIFAKLFFSFTERIFWIKTTSKNVVLNESANRRTSHNTTKTKCQFMGNSQSLKWQSPFNIHEMSWKLKHKADHKHTETLNHETPCPVMTGKSPFCCRIRLKKKPAKLL